MQTLPTRFVKTSSEFTKISYLNSAKLESGAMPGARQQMLLRARPAADFVAAPVTAPPQRQPQQPTRQS